MSTKKFSLLAVENLCKKFPVNKNFFGRPVNFIPAIDNVSFELKENETLAVVGESGSGKSSLCRAILHFFESDSGKILINNKAMPKDKKGKLAWRRNIQMIFQDISESLNPRFTVQELVMEPLIVHQYKTKELQKKRVQYLLDLVGFSRRDLIKYPHEFSGGQKQRIGIARALALSPKIIVADEPVSALDISIQNQILKLFDDIQKEFKISYLFVTHDLNVVKKISDRILILYLGKVVEIGDSKKIFTQSSHPYTKLLMDSVLADTPNKRRKLNPIQGDITSFFNLPKGCYFQPRCLFKTKKCEEYPSLEKKKNSFAACWHSEKIFDSLLKN